MFDVARVLRDLITQSAMAITAVTFDADNQIRLYPEVKGSLERLKRRYKSAAGQE